MAHATHNLPQRTPDSAAATQLTQTKPSVDTDENYVNPLCYPTMADNLPILKRKRATLLSNVIRCATAIKDCTDATTSDDLEYYRNRLQETLDQLTILDDSIHGSLNDIEYTADVQNCETYIDSAKRAIYKATRASTINCQRPCHA